MGLFSKSELNKEKISKIEYAAALNSLFNTKTEKQTFTCVDLQAKYSGIINKLFITKIQNKKEGEIFTLNDGQEIVTGLLSVVSKQYGKIPPEIKASCDLSLAVLAPSTLEKVKYIKSAVGVAGGLAGIGSIIGALGMVMGWGAGVLGAIQAFFVGVSLTGPIALAVGGLTIAGIATYFAFSKEDNATTAQKFKEALTKQVEKAIETTWNEYKYKFE